MGRKPRIEYAGAIIHVIQRGNNKEYIFENIEDKEFLIKEVINMSKNVVFRIFGYVIMNNHYHIILQTMENPLQNIMHRINNKYSKYYNYKYSRSGHVFQGRYKAIHIQDENYLLSLIRYIHQNPIKAGICKLIEEYRWSSDDYYRNNINGVIDIEVVLETISKNRDLAVKQYKEFMQKIDDNSFIGKDSVGNEAFEMIVKAKEHVPVRKRLDEILTGTGVSMEDYELIKKGSRKRHLTGFKISYANKALKSNYTHKEIGKNINLSDAAISKLLNSHFGGSSVE